jgi:hypothetical protein
MGSAGQKTKKMTDSQCWEGLWQEILMFKITIVHYFPKGLIKTFPRLNQLNMIIIENCGLKEIHRSDLFKETLNLKSNKLTSISDDLLVGMTTKLIEPVKFVWNYSALIK